MRQPANQQIHTFRKLMYFSEFASCNRLDQVGIRCQCYHRPWLSHISHNQRNISIFLQFYSLTWYWAFRKLTCHEVPEVSPLLHEAISRELSITMLTLCVKRPKWLRPTCRRLHIHVLDLKLYLAGRSSVNVWPKASRVLRWCGRGFTGPCVHDTWPNATWFTSQLHSFKLM